MSKMFSCVFLGTYVCTRVMVLFFVLVCCGTTTWCSKEPGEAVVRCVERDCPVERYREEGNYSSG